MDRNRDKDEAKADPKRGRTVMEGSSSAEEEASGSPGKAHPFKKAEMGGRRRLRGKGVGAVVQKEPSKAGGKKKVASKAGGKKKVAVKDRAVKRASVKAIDEFLSDQETIDEFLSSSSKAGAKKKVAVKDGAVKKASVNAKKKKKTKKTAKKVPDAEGLPPAVESSVAGDVSAPHRPHAERLAAFHAHWNAGNFIHGAGLNLPDVDGSNGQVKSQALQNFVVELVDEYVKGNSSPPDSDVWTPEWAWVHMYWIMHQSTSSQQLGSHVSLLSPSHVQSVISGYSPLPTWLQMKTWSPESIARGFWSTDVDNKNFGQYRCVALTSPFFNDL